MTTYQKMTILHPISANCLTYGSYAITFVRYIFNLNVTLTVCDNLGLVRFFFQKSGVYKFRSQPEKFSVLTIFEFRQILSFFSASKVTCCLMAFVADLKWRQHRWPCFQCRNHHLRIS